MMSNVVVRSSFYLKLGLLCIGFFFLGACQQGSNPLEQEEKKRPLGSPLEKVDSLTIQIENQPQNSDLYLQRAKYLFEEQNYASALADINKSIELDGNLWSAYVLKADIQMQYFQSLGSIQTLETALEKWPDQIEIKEKLAETYLIVKQIGKAEKIGKEIVASTPTQSAGYSILGWAAIQRSDTIAAIHYLQKSTQLNADLTTEWVELAKLMTPINPNLAKDYFENARTIAPKDTLVLHAYAMYYQTLDELEMAKKIYKEIITNHPSYQPALYNASLLLMDQDSFSIAIDYWNQLIDLSPKHAKYYYYRGICFELTQNYNEAKADYQKVNQLAPQMMNIQKALSSIEKKIQGQ